MRESAYGMRRLTSVVATSAGDTLGKMVITGGTVCLPSLQASQDV